MPLQGFLLRLDRRVEEVADLLVGEEDRGVEFVLGRVDGVQGRALGRGSCRRRTGVPRRGP
jgi:hypothetical protein